MTEKSLSLIIPVYNEEENLLPLYRSIVDAVDNLPVNTEIIFIDDGSTDNSFDRLAGLAEKDNRVKLVQLKRNFGQTSALASGIDCSSGEILIFLDADLQNDPGDIPLLLNKIDEGYDVVSGWRKNRKDPFWTRRLPSISANRLISLVTGIRLHDYGCTLKAYRREVLKKLDLYGEMHRILPAYCAWQGAKITEIAVKHHPRRWGKSKYTLGRTFKVILDLFVVKFFLTYLAKPIYVFGGAGIFCLALSMLLAVFVTLRTVFFTGIWLSPLLFIGIFLAGIGVLCLLMGFLAEILIRIYYESRGEKPYSIEQTRNFPPGKCFP